MTKKRTPATRTLTKLPAWKALATHYRKIGSVHLRSLFVQDSRRGERLAVEGAGLYLDYSKNRITDETIKLLINLACDCNLRECIESMFEGRKVNVTENRSVLHIALRAPKSEDILVDGVNVVPQVHAVLEKMA
ncbi:MAG: glucose-6-phosphate isomerase, partial [Syntrophales bacterium]